LTLGAGWVYHCVMEIATSSERGRFMLVWERGDDSQRHWEWHEPEVTSLEAGLRLLDRHTEAYPKNRYYLVQVIAVGGETR
jgi:hypothetical protein